MVTNNLSTPFPYRMRPISNITPFTYRDGLTYLEALENIRTNLRDVLIPELDANLKHLMEEFQKGITNAELTISEKSELWNTLFADYMAEVERNIGIINDKVIEKQVTPVIDMIDTASDPTAYLNRISGFAVVPARPAGTLWPQAFSVNEAEGHFYVAYSGSLDSGASSTTRITTFDLTGRELHYKQFVNDSGTSSEGLVFWRNGLEQLCFAVRPANSGRGYAIFNYDTSTLGPVIPLPGGNYKSAVAGDFFYTVNSNDSTNGFNQVYVYTLSSIKAGVPELVETIYLEARNKMEKVQSFTVNGGYIIFNHGASKGNILMSAYNLNGRLVTAFTLNKEDYADAVNATYPGMIKDRTYYRHESEGAWVYKGKTLTGHVIDNNSNDYRFVISAHNSINGTLVEARPESMKYDTGWIEIPLNPPFTAWDDASKPRMRRIGNVVYCDGAVTNVPNTFPALGHTIANISGYAPSRQKELPIQESTLGGYASWKIRPGGDLVLAETTVINPDAKSWYPFDFTWVQG